MAAKAFEASWIAPLSWLTDEKTLSVSTKPSSGNIRGGAVGRSTYPTSAIRLVAKIQLRTGTNASFRRK